MEFASHKIGETVEFWERNLVIIGEIIDIDDSGMATIKSDKSQFYYHDLCALKNLSRENHE